MTTIIANMDLHDLDYKIYIIEDSAVVNEFTADKDIFADRVLDCYTSNQAEKIVLNGNDLLTYHYEKEIRKKETNYAVSNIKIERTNIRG